MPSGAAAKNMYKERAERAAEIFFALKFPPLAPFFAVKKRRAATAGMAFAQVFFFFRPTGHNPRAAVEAGLQTLKESKL